MKKLYGFQSTLLCTVGIGALFGGMMAIIDPYGTLYGAPIEILKRGPFTNFLIPGLFLFFVIGIGHLVAFIFVRNKLKYHVYISGGLGCILMAWIAIQCYVLQSIQYLHIIFFLIGLIESLIALSMLIKLRLFPFSKSSM
ncbi:hypothetical protein [Proteiniborus sp. MB09-C3]|uniref:hypothetical protein n=1 Tax=Proteiniborus sp. MB09-C3 TaxID=3050072 RepID=UPI0025552FA7|nr:hypothetical protein [Proteiniborus sp. MB09-C3]WIV10648.1 hypothetical protein QO263_10810 [Proteiniborus sp. MB09-C3]